jgi:hypothetical protein
MQNFDKTWRQKLSTLIKTRTGDAARDQIMPGGTDPPGSDNQLEVIVWTREAMNRMEALLDPQTCHEILSDCACHYPDEQLATLRTLYKRTGDLEQVHAVLQRQFEMFLRENLGLDEDMISDVIDRGWGAAGILSDGSIVATKIPKSGNLRDYLEERDPEVRRSMYCHCPRVRDAVRAGEALPRLYCYCGAGFYKHMWETILENTVRVEVLESVLSGGEVCRVAISLPSGI